MDGAFFDNGNAHSFAHAELEFSSWESLHMRYFDGRDEHWQKCNYDYDELKDLCEFDVSETQIKLRGFGRYTGKWIEVEITGGSAILRV